MRIEEKHMHPRTVFRSSKTKMAFALLAAVIIAWVFAVGQDATGRAANNQTDKARTREWAEKHFPHLVRPDFAKLDLARMPPELSEGPEKLTAPFKAGEVINFRLLITNGSNGKVYFPITGPYEHDRPRLSKGSDPVPYRQDAERQVQLADTQRGYNSVKYYELEPGDTATEFIKLDDWYEPLHPGVYRLIVRHRFILAGEWIDSPPINFEVVP